MRKILILFFSLLSLFYIPGAKEEAITITIPLIPSSKKITSEIYDISTLRLRINNEDRKISSLQKIERTLGLKPDLGRNFILSFDMSESGENIIKGISYFITEILVPSDSLIVISPFKIYQIKVSGNKEKVITDITGILKKDCLLYKKKRLSFKKSIRNELVKIRSVLAERSKSSNFRVTRYKKIIGFLNYFPEEFKRYLKLTTVLNLSKLEFIKKITRLREGERWWIHFHREELGELFTSIARVVREIEAFSAGGDNILNQDLSPLLKNLTKLLYSTGFFPLNEFKKGMLSSEICFNTVQFFMGERNNDHVLLKKKSIYKNIFYDVSSYSGGTSFRSNYIENGLRKIRDHKFIFYKLQFHFNGREEEKNISLINSKNNKEIFRYREIIGKKDLVQIIKNFRSEKCSIENFVFERNSARFFIKNFMIDMKRKFGLLKVRIILSGPEGKVEYYRENALRASGKRFSLKIPVPARLSGKFMLKIQVTDLLANRKTEYSRNVDVR